MLQSVQISLLAILLGMAGFVSASTLSISAGGGIWQTTPTGQVSKTGDPAPVDVEQDLFWGKENQNSFFLALEHPIPVLPNVRLSQINLSQSGSGPVTFTYNGQTFTGTVTNSADIRQTDILLYYEVLDDTLMLNLDLGLDIKLLDMSYNIRDTFGNATSDSYSITLPLLYGMFGITPIDPLYLGVEAQYVTYQGSTLTDVLAKISYTFDFRVGIEAGYRLQSIELDNVNDATGKLDFKGPFAGIYLRF